MDLTSKADYDLALADMELSKYRLEATRNNLRYTTLKAPFDGLISSVKVENREIVKASQSIVNLHASDGVDITFQLPESILSQLNMGVAETYRPKISFTSSAKHKDQVYRASFKEMDRDVDPRTRTYKVTLTMNAPDSVVIVPGMTASVLLELDQIIDGTSAYYLVPLESVFSPAETNPDDKQYAVWKLDRETMMVSQQMVTIDGITDEGVRVTSGLNEGDEIVAAGVQTLLDGMKVSEWKKQRGI
ncbi:efflux RND transporter periplasmic adaptor subunit [Candidatus Pelagadaptatus aseana]|uniref:efflux RND transporter periplasmic adaptor subunit n=1 Tax=Candidatus Pelagadaptatus aseana TaxID=3120508 RepID=UPI003C6F0C98